MFTNKKVIIYIILGLILAVFIVYGVAYLYDTEELTIEHEDSGNITSVEDADFSKLPMSFQENKGQVDDVVRFLVKNGSSTIFFTPEEVVYSLVTSQPERRRGPSARERDFRDSEEKLEGIVIRQKFIGALDDLEIKGEVMLEGKVNYFVGNNEEDWIKEAATFSSIRYAGLYEGVDLLFSGSNSQLKYEYHIKPNSDPSAIEVLVEGVDNIVINPDGIMVFETAVGNMAQPVVKAYQVINGEIVNRSVRYDLIDDYRYKFVLEEYDQSVELIISI